jgi:hypothetical protein
MQRFLSFFLFFKNVLPYEQCASEIVLNSISSYSMVRSYNPLRCRRNSEYRTERIVVFFFFLKKKERKNYLLCRRGEPLAAIEKNYD